MMDSVEAHRFKLKFYPIKVSANFDGKNIDDTLIRVSLFKDEENTGIGNSIFASGMEYPEEVMWSIRKE